MKTTAYKLTDASNHDACTLPVELVDAGSKAIAVYDGSADVEYASLNELLAAHGLYDLERYQEDYKLSQLWHAMLQDRRNRGKGRKSQTAGSTRW